MPDSLRLFVAVELPGEVREALSRLQHDLQCRGLEKLRWVRPEGIHLTLKFLGKTPSERVGAIEAALAEASGGATRHTLYIGRLGGFGSRQRPRVLWVDLTGELPQLTTLQEQIEKSLDEIGFPPKGRPFAPHLTLARVRPETALDIRADMGAAIEEVKPPPLPIPVDDVSLMRSTLRPSGAVYDRLAAFPLGGA